MTPLKEQIIYIPIDRPSHGSEYTLTCNRGDKFSFEVECLPNQYILSKEQIIELLQTSFDYGVQRVQMGKLTPDRNTFVHLIIH